MTLSDLYRRYDGPIPWWELSSDTSHSRYTLLLFHRNRALDAARSALSELVLASAAQADIRLDHWQNALRLVQRYGTERRAHSSAATPK